MEPSLGKHLTSRRSFLGATSAATTASLTIQALASSRPVHSAQNDDGNLKLGLVGCGGRGAGAANQALTADENVTLHAMCDLEHNAAERGADATMAAILECMSNYSGQEVTWDDAMASNQTLVPDNLVDFNSPAPIQPDADGYYLKAAPGVSDPFELWY